MDITPDQIAKTRRVGVCNGADVFLIETKGGYQVIASKDSNGQLRYYGVGPHAAVAKYIARKREPHIRWTVLEKSDVHVDPGSALVARYERLTATLDRS